MIALARALVLADGFADGHLPMTETVPAPLVPVAGRVPIDSALDRIADHGIAGAVVAAHRHAARIAAHLAARTTPAVEALPLPEALDSGGTVARALGRLGPGPFLVVDANALRLDGATPALARLAAAWDDAAMDALLLVHPTVSAAGVPGAGEVFVDPAGRARLRAGNEMAPYAYAGAQIVHPRLFAEAPAGAFAIAALWARAAEAGRLFAVVSDGALFRLATPDARAEAEDALAQLGLWRRPGPARAG